MAQQNEYGDLDSWSLNRDERGDVWCSGTGAAEERGKVDYYAVAHQTSKKITKRPSLLVGATLKDY